MAPSEAEYAELLRCLSGAGGGDGERVALGWALLHRLKCDLRLLGPVLLAVVRAWFEALGGWMAVTTAVDEGGACAADPAVALQPVDLTDAEREELTSAIAAMSRARERASDFERFTAWAEQARTVCVLATHPLAPLHTHSHACVSARVPAARPVRYDCGRRERGHVQPELRGGNV